MKEISYLQFLSYENTLRGILMKGRNAFGTNFKLKTYSVSNATLCDIWNYDTEKLSYESIHGSYLLFRGELSYTGSLSFAINLQADGYASIKVNMSHANLLFLSEDRYDNIRMFFLPILFDLGRIKDFTYLAVAVQHMLDLILFGQKYEDRREVAVAKLLEIKNRAFGN